MNTRGQSLSPWMASAPKMEFPSLSESISTEVCVVGGGIAGLTTAYLVAKAGLKVVVVEAAEIGAGETGRTTAHFVTAHDNRYTGLKRLHGLRKTKLIAQSLVESINQVEQIVEEGNIECDLERVPGYLYLAQQHPERLLRKELKTIQQVHLPGVQWKDEITLGQLHLGPGLEFSDQIQLHITKYLAGLCQGIQKYGGKIFIRTRMSGLSDKPHLTVQTDSGATISARWVVQATNSPAYAPAMQFSKQPPKRTCVVGASVPKGTLPHALWWDTGEVYHYTRLQPVDQEHELLLLGGEDHATGTDGNTFERFQRLEAFMQTVVPVEKIDFHWTGQVLESLDGLAYIGEYKKMPGVLYITGDSGMGMTHSTIGAMILTEHMQGRKHPWAEVYQPRRLPLRAWMDFAQEGMRLTWAYTTGWLGKGGKRVEELKPGQGTVTKQGRKHLAVYKDHAGKVHAKSAVCPHLKCVVAWNATEQSFDCPCHGSRFDAQGKIINAPTLGHLPPRKLG